MLTGAGLTIDHRVRDGVESVMDQQQENPIILRVKDCRGGCLKPGNRIVVHGRKIDLEQSSAVCVDAVAQTLSMIRDMGGVEGNEFLKSFTFHCPVKDCGATLGLIVDGSITVKSDDKPEFEPTEASFLGQIDAETKELFLEGATSTTYQAGETILEPNTVPDELLVLESGEAGLYLPGGVGHDDALLMILDAGDCLGALSLVTGYPTSSAIRARNECTILSMVKEDFELLMEASQSLSRTFLRTMYQRFSENLHVLQDERKASYRGRVESLSAPDIVQNLAATGRTGVLSILNKNLLGRMAFEEGAPKSCVLLDAGLVPQSQRFRDEVAKEIEPLNEGVDAMLGILAWGQGEFRFHEGAVEERGPVEMDLMSILVEAARQIDEEGLKLTLFDEVEQ